MNEIAIIEKENITTRKDIDDLVDRFLSCQDVAESSRQTYQRCLKPFLSWATDEELREPDRQDILRYKRYIQERGLSALTLSSYMVVVRKFFEWAEAEKLYFNIARGIKGGKRSKGFKKDALTISQIKELLGSIDRSSLVGKRDFALINLLIRTALRTIEVVRADCADAQQKGGDAVLWIRGKGRDSKDEFVLLTPPTLKPLHDYLKARGKAKDKKPLFTSLSNRNGGGRLTCRTVSRIVKERLRDIGINSPRLTAHSLRHTSITLALLAGCSIQEAKTLGRHADINTTLIYSHNIDRVANAPERRIDAILNGKDSEDAGISGDDP